MVPIRVFHLERDFEAVRALWQAAGPGVGLGQSDSRHEIEKKLQRDPDLFLVAVRGSGPGEQVVGAVMGGFDGRRGLVYHLAVAKDYRGQGIGGALMAELEARLRSRGCLKCYLMVRPDNDAVVEFYRQRGWDVMPVRLLGKNFS